MAWVASVALAWPGKGIVMSGSDAIAAGRCDAYTIDEVWSVAKRQVGQVPAVLDAGYTEYTITLKDGTVRVAKVLGMTEPREVDRIFRETGYIGSVKELMARQ